MAGINQFVPFATGAGANVEDITAYIADPETGSGHISGIASSARANRSWRQATFIAAGIAGYMADDPFDIDMLDDGDLAKFKLNFHKMLIASQPRVPLPANAAYTVYVSNAGDDSGPGTAAAPWKTIQYAVNQLLFRTDFNGNKVTIKIADGTYASWVHTGNPTGCLGAHNFVYEGNLAVPTNVVIQGNTLWGCSLFTAGAQCYVKGMKFTGPLGDSFTAAMYIQDGCSVFPWNVDFGNMGSGIHILAEAGNAGVWGPYTISGSALAHYYATYGGSVSSPGRPSDSFIGGPFLVTLIGNPTFAASFAYASAGATISITNAVSGYSGPCTGPRFATSTHASILSGGRGPSFFPGTVAGIIDTATYGVYA